MNNNLAPTYQRLYGEHWVLWYAESNSYSVVESSFKSILDFYLQSATIDNFNAKLKLSYKGSDYNVLATEVLVYLKSCNTTFISELNTTLAIDTSFRKIIKQYAIKGKCIRIYYDSELVLKTIHPSLAHLETRVTQNSAATTFDIYLKDAHLQLYKDGMPIISVPKRDYHLIQGKFIMQLLCVLYNKQESDWMAAFHGSTVTDGISSMLFIGASGKGKSTLCALLAANGFSLVADDVSPVLAENLHIYHNPSAISIKEGAFSVLQKFVSNFETLAVVEFNKAKGLLRYLPSSNPDKDGHPCKAIVLVNYQKDAETSLQNIPIKTALETLIPESWLSPNPIHVKLYLDWLSTLQFYQLTYSDNNDVIERLSKAYKDLNN